MRQSGALSARRRATRSGTGRPGTSLRVVPDSGRRPRESGLLSRGFSPGSSIPAEGAGRCKLLPPPPSVCPSVRPPARAGSSGRQPQPAPRWPQSRATQAAPAAQRVPGAISAARRGEVHPAARRAARPGPARPPAARSAQPPVRPERARRPRGLQGGRSWRARSERCRGARAVPTRRGGREEGGREESFCRGKQGNRTRRAAPRCSRKETNPDTDRI